VLFYLVAALVLISVMTAIHRNRLAEQYQVFEQKDATHELSSSADNHELFLAEETPDGKSASINFTSRRQNKTRDIVTHAFLKSNKRTCAHFLYDLLTWIRNMLSMLNGSLSKHRTYLE